MYTLGLFCLLWMNSVLTYQKKKVIHVFFLVATFMVQIRIMSWCSINCMWVATFWCIVCQNCHITLEYTFVLHLLPKIMFTPWGDINFWWNFVCIMELKHRNCRSVGEGNHSSFSFEFLFLFICFWRNFWAIIWLVFSFSFMLLGSSVVLLVISCVVLVLHCSLEQKVMQNMLGFLQMGSFLCLAPWMDLLRYIN